MENSNNDNKRYCCNMPAIPSQNECIYTTNQTLSIGDKAPEFTANTTFGKCKLSDYKGKWLVFFCHPGDHTPVKS